MTPQTVPLSALIDRLAGDGPRDALFVRAFTAWLHEHASRLRLVVVEELKLRDVVVTFKMKDRVRLIITGYPTDLPGDVTVTVDEREFPFVEVTVAAGPCADPYEICTLDYAPAGRGVRVTSGAHEGAQGALVVAATIGGRQENRVRLASGEIVTLSGDVLELVD